MTELVLSLTDAALSLMGNAGQVDILRGISLDVVKGETLGLVGPSGSGKSSLLMLMGGLEQATGGTVTALGRDLTTMNEDQLARFRRDNMGVVFQSFHLIPTMTALENVATPLELAGHRNAFARAAAELATVGLADRADHYPSQLSGANSSGVALARASAPRPRILLADEPTGNLDATNGQAIIEMLFDLRDRHGATLVLVTHAEELASRCDRVVHLRDGRIEPDAAAGDEGGGMTLAIASRLAGRELRGGLRGFRIFLACLALGVAAIAAVGITRASIQAGLEREGAALLGGDAEIEFTYRFARPDEMAWMQGIAETVSETVDFRSMIVVGDDATADRALTQVKAVDSAYPLIGTVTLDPPIPLADALRGGENPGAVMERVLADRLGLTPGDNFRMGTQSFVLSAILDRYPDNASGGFGLGPRTIVLTRSLASSGLIAEGTLFSTQYRLDLPEAADLQTLENAAAVRFRDSGLRWRDARRGAGGTAVFVDRLGAFLILMGLSGLAVGGVGVSAAVRSYLAGKTSVIATLKTLGATRQTILLTYFLQIGALTLLGIVLGLFLGAGLPLVLAPLIEAQLPIPAEFALYPRPLAEAALYGLLAALIFTLWPLARAEDVRAATLFRDALSGGRALPRPVYLVATSLLVAALIGAAVMFSGTAFLTLWTAGGIATALGILVLAAVLARWLARRMARGARGRPALRLALGAIGARGGETVSVVLSLGLGLAVLATVGQIDGNLRRAIADELPAVAPSYFFVDIQPDQIDGFRARLADDPAVSKVDAAPMLRGIVTAINGRPARDVTDHWVVQGDRGLTYAAEMPADTTLTAGEWWPADYDGPPLISFSAEEAAEIGLGLGDTVTINILGRDITATIASLREVNFETAGIGFVMSMNPAALAGAPHSWIATVYAEPEAEAQILRDLAGAYPNITAIRIRDAITRVSEVIGGIAAATRYGAAATLLTGFLVLIGAAAAGEQGRTYEAAVLKTLGATRGRILASFALRAALLGVAAGVVALAAGMLGGWAVSTFVMEMSFAVVWSSAIGIVLGGVLATLLAGLAFAVRPLAARPARVLRARE